MTVGYWIKKVYGNFFLQLNLVVLCMVVIIQWANKNLKLSVMSSKGTLLFFINLFFEVGYFFLLRDLETSIFDYVEENPIKNSSAKALLSANETERQETGEKQGEKEKERERNSQKVDWIPNGKGLRKGEIVKISVLYNLTEIAFLTTLRHCDPNILPMKGTEFLQWIFFFFLGINFSRCVLYSPLRKREFWYQILITLSILSLPLFSQLCNMNVLLYLSLFYPANWLFPFLISPYSFTLLAEKSKLLRAFLPFSVSSSPGDTPTPSSPLYAPALLSLGWMGSYFLMGGIERYRERKRRQNIVLESNISSYLNFTTQAPSPKASRRDNSSVSSPLGSPLSSKTLSPIDWQSPSKSKIISPELALKEIAASSSSPSVKERAVAPSTTAATRTVAASETASSMEKKRPAVSFQNVIIKMKSCQKKSEGEERENLTETNCINFTVSYNELSCLSGRDSWTIRAIESVLMDEGTFTVSSGTLYLSDRPVSVSSVSQPLYSEHSLSDYLRLFCEKREGKGRETKCGKDEAVDVEMVISHLLYSNIRRHEFDEKIINFSPIQRINISLIFLVFLFRQKIIYLDLSDFDELEIRKEILTNDSGEESGELQDIKHLETAIANTWSLLQKLMNRCEKLSVIVRSSNSTHVSKYVKNFIYIERKMCRLSCLPLETASRSFGSTIVRIYLFDENKKFDDFTIATANQIFMTLELHYLMQQFSVAVIAVSASEITLRTDPVSAKNLIRFINMCRLQNSQQQFYDYHQKLIQRKTQINGNTNDAQVFATNYSEYDFLVEKLKPVPPPPPPVNETVNLTPIKSIASKFSALGKVDMTSSPLPPLSPLPVIKNSSLPPLETRDAGRGKGGETKQEETKDLSNETAAEIMGNKATGEESSTEEPKEDLICPLFLSVYSFSVEVELARTYLGKILRGEETFVEKKRWERKERSANDINVFFLEKLKPVENYQNLNETPRLDQEIIMEKKNNWDENLMEWSSWISFFDEFVEFSSIAPANHQILKDCKKENKSSFTSFFRKLEFIIFINFYQIKWGKYFLLQFICPALLLSCSSLFVTYFDGNIGEANVRSLSFKYEARLAYFLLCLSLFLTTKKLYENRKIDAISHFFDDKFTPVIFIRLFRFALVCLSLIVSILPLHWYFPKDHFHAFFSLSPSLSTPFRIFLMTLSMHQVLFLFVSSNFLRINFFIFAYLVIFFFHQNLEFHQILSLLWCLVSFYFYARDFYHYLNNKNLVKNFIELAQDDLTTRKTSLYSASSSRPNSINEQNFLSSDISHVRHPISRNPSRVDWEMPLESRTREQPSECKSACGSEDDSDNSLLSYETSPSYPLFPLDDSSERSQSIISYRVSERGMKISAPQIFIRLVYREKASHETGHIPQGTSFRAPLIKNSDVSLSSPLLHQDLETGDLLGPESTHPNINANTANNTVNKPSQISFAFLGRRGEVYTLLHPKMHLRHGRSHECFEAMSEQCSRGEVSQLLEEGRRDRRGEKGRDREKRKRDCGHFINFLDFSVERKCGHETVREYLSRYQCMSRLHVAPSLETAMSTCDVGREYLETRLRDVSRDVLCLLKVCSALLLGEEFLMILNLMSLSPRTLRTLQKVVKYLKFDEKKIILFIFDVEKPSKIHHVFFDYYVSPLPYREHSLHSLIVKNNKLPFFSPIRELHANNSMHIEFQLAPPDESVGRLLANIASKNLKNSHQISSFTQVRTLVLSWVKEDFRLAQYDGLDQFLTDFMNHINFLLTSKNHFTGNKKSVEFAISHQFYETHQILISHLATLWYYARGYALLLHYFRSLGLEIAAKMFVQPTGVDNSISVYLPISPLLPSPLLSSSLLSSPLFVSPISSTLAGSIDPYSTLLDLLLIFQSHFHIPFLQLKMAHTLIHKYHHIPE